MKTFIENGDEVIEVNWHQIKGVKQMADGSWRFKTIGGPCHDWTIRVYPPCDRIVFNDKDVYVLRPPVRKGGNWAYVHDENGDASPMETVRVLAEAETLLNNGGQNHRNGICVACEQPIYLNLHHKTDVKKWVHLGTGSRFCVNGGGQARPTGE